MEEENRRPWSDLPDDVSDLIVGRLSFVDQIIFGAVCKSWMTYTIHRSPPPPLNRIPWLMVLDDTDKFTCKLVDPTSKKTYTFDIKSLKKKIKNLNTMKVHESKDGWLLISSQLKTKFSASEPLFLYSPFATNGDNNIIELPTVNYSKSFSYATFSTNPLSEDCLFLTLSPISDKNIICIRTCRRRDDSWTSRNFKCESWLCYDNKYISRCWLYSEGILYYLVPERKMGSLDIARGEWAVLPSPPDNPRGWKYYYKKIELKYYKIHMVKLDGELIIINGNHGNVIDQHCYYYGEFLRLDLSQMTWECEHFHDCKVEGNITCFAGSGYTSIIRLCEEKEKKKLQEVYHCLTLSYPELSYFMSYLNNPGLDLYGPIAEKCCRKLWIDPVVLTFLRNKSEMLVERKATPD